jgi:cytochrome c biogenesis protein
MLEKIWKFFCSLKLLGILLTLGSISVLIGSFIIQRNNAQEGQLELAYSAETLRIFGYLGFIDLYHSAWFVFIIAMIGVNVICCSIDMWPRHVKKAFHDDSKLSVMAMRNQPVMAELPITDLNKIETLLVAGLKKWFKAPERVDVGGALRLVVNKMRLAHFGVYIVHLGLIVVFIGGVVGSIDGYEGQMSLTEGETSNKIYVKNAVRKKKTLDFSVKCHSVKVITYDNGSPKDYMSDLEVLDKNGKSVKREVIEVNKPLSYQGINFYQATYGKQKTNEQKFYLVSLTDNKTGKKVSVRVAEADPTPVPNSRATLTVLNYNEDARIPTDEGLMPLGPALRVSYNDGKKIEEVILFKDYPELDDKLRTKAAQKMVFSGMQEDFELQEVTGLQVSRDAGAAVVFWGFGIMMIGIFWAFFTSHQKVWAVVDGNTLILAGRTHRNPWGFKARFNHLVEELKLGNL